MSEAEIRFWIVEGRYRHGGGGVSDVSAFLLVWKLFFHLKVMADILQWSVPGLRANLEELRLLCNQYNPQISDGRCAGMPATVKLSY